MLLKLIKNEIRVTKDVMKKVYSVYIILALVTFVLCFLSLAMNINFGETQSTVSTISIAIITNLALKSLEISSIVLIALCGLYLAYRLYCNLIAEGGYVMMTLPTKPKNHLMANIITLIFWTTLSIVLVATVLIVFSDLALPIANASSSFISLFSTTQNLMLAAT